MLNGSPFASAPLGGALAAVLPSLSTNLLQRTPSGPSIFDQMGPPAPDPPTAHDVDVFIDDLKPAFAERDAVIRLCRRVSRLAGIRARQEEDRVWYLPTIYQRQDEVVPLSLPATLLRKAAELIATRDSIVDVPQDEDSADARRRSERLERLIRSLNDGWDRIWERGGNANTMAYTIVYRLLEDGCVAGILRKEPTDPRVPTRLAIVDPLTLYPVFDGEDLIACGQVLRMSLAEIAREFGGDVALAIESGRNDEELRIFYDKHWMVACHNGEILRAVYHNYGFCPVRMRFIGGTIGTVDTDHLLEEREAARGVPLLLSLIPELEAIYRQTDSLLKLSAYNANPAIKIKRNPGQKNPPEVLLEPGEPIDLQPQEDVEPIILDPAGLAHVQAALQSLQMNVFSATMNLMDDRQVASGVAYLAVAEERHVFLTPVIRALCSFESQNDEDALQLIRGLGFPVTVGEATYQPEEIGPYVCVKRRLNPLSRMEQAQTLITLGQSYQMGLFSREYVLEHYLGVEDASQVVRAADMDMAARSPLALQASANIGVLRWYTREIQRATEQGEQQIVNLLTAQRDFAYQQMLQAAQPPQIPPGVQMQGQPGGAPGQPLQMQHAPNDLMSVLGQMAGQGGMPPGVGAPPGGNQPAQGPGAGPPNSTMSPEAISGSANRMMPPGGMMGPGGVG